MTLENKFELDIIRKDGIKHLTLYEITLEERKGKDLVGSAEGLALGHCVGIGIRHGTNFVERTKYYCFSKEYPKSAKPMSPEHILVEFYGDK